MRKKNFFGRPAKQLACLNHVMSCLCASGCGWVRECVRDRAVVAIQVMHNMSRLRRRSMTTVTWTAQERRTLQSQT